MLSSSHVANLIQLHFIAHEKVTTEYFISGAFFLDIFDLLFLFDVSFVVLSVSLDLGLSEEFNVLF